MPTLQLADLWRESGRYDAYGPEMLRIRDRHDRELLYGPTNEDMITEIFRAGVRSYRSLPLNLYHMQWKFRDEQRPRFGVMRGREFLMKDAYSFDIDEASARRAYNRMFVAYLRTFARMGLKAIPMRAETGPIGGDLSHEFIVLADTGESGVYCDRRVLDLPIPGDELDYDDDLSPWIARWTDLYAATEDVHDAARFEREVAAGDRLHTRGIEVGQVFYFGTKYSQPMKALVAGPDGTDRPIHGGSYGIGLSRLVGAIIEASHDAAGIIWPEPVAPFKVALVNPEAGRRCGGCDLRDALCESPGCRHRRAVRRHGGTRGREAVDDGPHQHSVADRGRPARSRQRCRRDQASRDGRADRARSGRGAHKAKRLTMGDLLWQKEGVAVDARIMRFLAGDDVVLDREFFSYDIAASKVHVEGLARIGVIERAEAAALVRELDALDEDFAHGRFVLDERFEDGHSAIEARLVERLGDTGRKVHAGRSRNDQILVATRLWLKARLGALIAAESRDRGGVPRPRRRRSAPSLPGYTHLQRAVVSSTAMWFAGFAEAFIDDAARARDTFAWIDANPLGTAAGYGVNLALDREHATEALGFARMQINPVYAQLSRGKFEIGALDALAAAVLDLRRMAWDLSLFHDHAEFGFVHLPAEYTTGSSIMPNKRNPDVIELMRATYASIAAARTEIEQLLSLPSGYQRDLQFSKGAIVHGFRRGLAALELLPDLLARLAWNADRMPAAIEPSMYATDAAIEAAAAGTPFRDAYRSAAEAGVSAGEGRTPEASLAARVSPGAFGDLRLDTLRERLKALD